MSTKWKKGFDPKIILEKLAGIRTLDGDKVSFGGFEYDEYFAVLKSMIEIDEDISPEIGQSLMSRGLFEAAKKKELTAQSVISSVKDAVRNHLAKPNLPFWLVTTLNVSINDDLPRYSINGCSLRFYKKLPYKYRKARLKAILEVSSWLIDKDENSSYYVVAHVDEKTEYDAAAKMLDAIDFIRGIWNLHINKAMVLSFGGRKKPINQVTLGALHTLHHKSGNGTSGNFWYEPEYFENHDKVYFSKKSYITLEFTKDVRKYIKKNCYGKDIEAAIIRYVRALDSQDYNGVFIKLWSVLECLTGTLKESYDKTIKRTVFQCADREYNKQVLEHLRQYRNRSVHLGSGTNDIEIHVYQLKSYIDRLLRFHIINDLKLSSLQEAAEFMDLDPDKEALKKQIALRQAGIKFMGG